MRVDGSARALFHLPSVVWASSRSNLIFVETRVRKPPTYVSACSSLHPFTPVNLFNRTSYSRLVKLYLRHLLPPYSILPSFDSSLTLRFFDVIVDINTKQRKSLEIIVVFGRLHWATGRMFLAFTNNRGKWKKEESGGWVGTSCGREFTVQVTNKKERWFSIFRPRSRGAYERVRCTGDCLFLRRVCDRY